MNKFVLDCGKCSAHSYNVATDEYHNITHRDIVDLNIPNIKRGDTIIIEDAHMRSREHNSLAQPFDYLDLVKIYENAKEKKIKILMFPHQSTPTARKIASFDKPELLEKNDTNDVKAIAIFLERRPSAFAALKTFYPLKLEDHYEKSKHKYEDRDRLTQDINIARNQNYGLKDNYSDAITDWIKKNYEKLADNLNDKELCSFIGIEYDKNNKIKRSTAQYKHEKLKHLYGFVCTILMPDGNLRCRSDLNIVPYWKYAKSVYFALTPFHMHGGALASNYKYHKRKSSSDCDISTSLESKYAMKSVEDFELIVEARTRCDKKLRTVWRTIRKMIVEDNIR